MKKFVKNIALGSVTGFVNGLFGSGGGTILVPALQRFLNVDTVESHATAIAVIFPLSILSAFVYTRSSSVDWLAVLFVSAGGLTGGIIGSKLLSRLSNSLIHKIFGFFMIVGAIRMIL
jgi:uncharacterized membrane protein YfcA